MTLSEELAELFDRDLQRLAQQVAAYPDDQSLWFTRPGLTNSAGNLVLHLEGNLREFLGRQLGAVPYQRQRDLEFSSRDLSRAELLARIDKLRPLLREVLTKTTEATWNSRCPEQRNGIDFTWRQFALHLLGHLSYHLGQIDYLRRLLGNEGPLPYAEIRR